jgi:hypothetical protein
MIYFIFYSARVLRAKGVAVKRTGPLSDRLGGRGGFGGDRGRGDRGRFDRGGRIDRGRGDRGRGDRGRNDRSRMDRGGGGGRGGGRGERGRKRPRYSTGCFGQGCGSGSVSLLDPDSVRPVDPESDQYSESRSGSRIQEGKNDPQK